MRRTTIAPRDHWQAKVESLGLVWHTAADAPYWNEAAYYSFTLAEIEDIERATSDLYEMFLQAGDYIVSRQLFDRFGIPEWCWPLIERAWRDEPPALNYGRFDLGYDGSGPPKLFEFNCDTPTSLLEAAVIQWAWKEERFPANDQFNSLHDKLVAKWRDIAPYLRGDLVHFGHVRDAAGEDAVTTAYLMDTAHAAGLTGQSILMTNVGWDGRIFRDLDNRPISTLYKLYPWEWLVHEPFGEHLARDQGATVWIEPIWKMIWSNKAILAVLWDMFPRHPNLLWASCEKPASDSYVSKPWLAREGANVTVVRSGQRVAERHGSYDGPLVYQGLFDLPNFDDQRPVLGSWVVDGEPAGMGVREDGLITGNLSRFVPHIIV
jgi:glutathionylspermidine synthase